MTWENVAPAQEPPGLPASLKAQRLHTLCPGESSRLRSGVPLGALLGARERAIWSRPHCHQSHFCPVPLLRALRPSERLRHSGFPRRWGRGWGGAHPSTRGCWVPLPPRAQLRLLPVGLGGALASRLLCTGSADSTPRRPLLQPPPPSPGSPLSLPQGCRQGLSPTAFWP